jgi:hypothetical protein
MRWVKLFRMLFLACVQEFCRPVNCAAIRRNPTENEIESCSVMFFGPTLCNWTAEGRGYDYWPLT